jgi:hypothetical protein
MLIESTNITDTFIFSKKFPPISSPQEPSISRPQTDALTFFVELSTLEKIKGVVVVVSISTGIISLDATAPRAEETANHHPEASTNSALTTRYIKTMRLLTHNFLQSNVKGCVFFAITCARV